MPENNDISSIITKIIQNPEFTEMVSGLRGGDNSSSESAQNKEKIQIEMLEKLPEVMNMVAPLLGENKSGENNDNQERKNVETDGNDTIAVSTKPSQSKKYDKDKAEKLMNALKPYMNPERCRIIDKCVSIMELGDVMGAIGGLDLLKKG